MEPHGYFSRVSHCPTENDVVRNCIHELGNVFCGKEEEEQAMEEWVVILRDTMHMFVTEAESQGLVGVALKGYETIKWTKEKMADPSINF